LADLPILPQAPSARRDQARRLWRDVSRQRDWLDLQPGTILILIVTFVVSLSLAIGIAQATGDFDPVIHGTFPNIGLGIVVFIEAEFISIKFIVGTYMRSIRAVFMAPTGHAQRNHPAPLQVVAVIGGVVVPRSLRESGP
jgi:hypothetical protein